MFFVDIVASFVALLQSYDNIIFLVLSFVMRKFCLNNFSFFDWMFVTVFQIYIDGFNFFNWNNFVINKEIPTKNIFFLNNEDISSYEYDRMILLFKCLCGCIIRCSFIYDCEHISLFDLLTFFVLFNIVTLIFVSQNFWFDWFLFCILVTYFLKFSYYYLTTLMCRFLIDLTFYLIENEFFYFEYLSKIIKNEPFLYF